MDIRKIVSVSPLANFVWTLCFAVEAFFAVSGNIVTIIIFQRRQLRRRAHFLLISLAVADLLVGLLSIPLYIAAKYVQNDSPGVFALVRGADMLPGFASIFTLTVIALERMYAVGWPFRHRVLKTQSYVIAIVAPWIMAFVVTFCANLLQLVNKHFIALILIMTFLITPVVVTCMAYLVLWKKERSRILRRHEVRETRDFRLGKTVAIITAAFLVTWLPFQILILSFSLCISCQVSPATINSTKLLHYANSIVNIVIYPVRNEEYRKALFQMFSSLCNRSGRSQNTLSATNFRNSTVFAVRNSSDTQRNFDHFHEKTRL